MAQAEGFITKYPFQGNLWGQCRALTHINIKIHHQKFLNALAKKKKKITIFAILIQRIASQVFLRTNQQDKPPWVFKQENTRRLYTPHQSNNWTPLNGRKVTETQCDTSQFMLLCKNRIFVIRLVSKAKHTDSIYKTQKQNIGQIWPGNLH